MELSKILAMVMTAIVLIIVRAYNVLGAVGKPARKGLDFSLITAISALVGYVLGVL